MMHYIFGHKVIEAYVSSYKFLNCGENKAHLAHLLLI